ncbi:MAG: FkbM family methyltransferase, partial [Alcaligenaceae bacterium]
MASPHRASSPPTAMPFISYAQNYEDVMLWRALRHVEQGFYIDVGALSPDVDSVTRAFSERGWHGINIEPHPFYFPQLVDRRPRDINLRLAIGEAAGTITMNYVERTGLSTADKEIARGHAEAGYAIESEQVPMTTLSAVWAEQVPAGKDVHFLKIDVEGFERAVIAGNNWSHHRPWILVVEATLPNSQIERHTEWEAILLSARYEFVYADGLNRFYVAQERPQLRAAFKYPPNVFDDFVLATTVLAQASDTAKTVQVVELAAELQNLRQQSREMEACLVNRARELGDGLLRMTQRAKTLTHFLRELQARVVVTEQSLISARQREKNAFAMGDQARLQAAALQELAASAHQQHAAILQSTSWRLTAPLRRVGAVVPSALRREMRRAAKLAWWSVTPWRLPQRIRFIQARSDVLRSGAMQAPRPAPGSL